MPYAKSKGRISMFVRMRKVQKDVTVAYFKVLYHNFSAEHWSLSRDKSTEYIEYEAAMLQLTVGI
jgi:hypothetical protein